MFEKRKKKGVRKFGFSESTEEGTGDSGSLAITCSIAAKTIGVKMQNNRRAIK